MRKIFLTLLTGLISTVGFSQLECQVNVSTMPSNFPDGKLQGSYPNETWGAFNFTDSQVSLAEAVFRLNAGQCPTNTVTISASINGTTLNISNAPLQITAFDATPKTIDFGTSGVKLSGSGGYGEGLIQIKGAANYTIKNMIVTGAPKEAITFKTQDGRSPTNVVLDGGEVSNSAEHGIKVLSSGGVTIKNMYVHNNGTSQNKTAAYWSGITVYQQYSEGKDMKYAGIRVENAVNVTMDGNTVSANDGYGIHFYNSWNSQGSESKLVNNKIGLSKDGLSPLGNFGEGVLVEKSGRVIVGQAGKGNVISANGNRSVFVGGTPTIGMNTTVSAPMGAQTSNMRGHGVEARESVNVEVYSNLIGTDITGNSSGVNNAFGNHLNGVYLNGSSWSTVGSTAAGLANTIGGNGFAFADVHTSDSQKQGTTLARIYWGVRHGVQLDDGAAKTEGNKIIGNYIGYGLNRVSDIANSEDGISVLGFSNGSLNNEIRNNTIGGSSFGIAFQGSQAKSNIVTSNLLGVTNTNGANPNALKTAGIKLQSGANSNIIGQSGLGNISIGNPKGIAVFGAGSTKNRILGNILSCNTNGGIDLYTGGNNDIVAPSINDADNRVNIVSGFSPSSGNVIDIYKVDSKCTGPCGSPLRQGKTWLGSVTAVVDTKFGTTKGTWELSLSALGLTEADRDSIVVTATDLNNNTSEFNTCTTAVLCKQPVIPTLTNSSLEFCEGSSLTLTAAAQAGFRYSWYKGTQFISGGLNANTVSVTTGGAYRLVVADPLDTLTCTTSLSPITVVQNNKPVITSVVPVTDATVCFGEKGIQFTANATSTNTPLIYTWTPPSGATIPTGQGTKTVTVDFNTTAVGASTVGVSIRDAKGCTSVGTPVNVEVVANPVITAHTGPTEACFNASASQIAVDSIPGATYQWSVIPASVAVPLSTTHKQAVANTVVGAVTFSVSITSDANGCASKTPYTAINYRVKPLPVASLSGNVTEACENSEVTIDASSSITGSTFDWSVTGATQNTLDGPASVDVTMGATNATIAVVPTANGCTGASVNTVVNVVNLPVTSAIQLSDDSVCLDQTGVTFTVDAPNGTDGSVYTWSVTNGVTLSGTGNVRTANFAAATPGIAIITVVEETGGALACKQPTPTTAEIEIFGTPVITGAIATSSENPICDEKGVTYSVNGGVTPDGFTYVWTVPTGATIVSTTTNEATITVDLSDQNGDVTVTVFNEAGCEGETKTLPIVLSGCNLKAAIDVKTDFCIGDDIITVRNISTGDVIDSIRWDFGVDATPTTSSENEVTLSFASPGDYEISLIAYEGSASDTAKTTITVHPKPNKADLTLTAPATVCPNAENVRVETVGLYQSNSTYTWVIDPLNGAAVVGNSDTNSVLLQFNTVTPIAISVVEENEFGCKDTSAIETISLFEVPAPFSIEGVDVVCIENSSEYSFNIVGGNGGDFVWTLIPDTTGIITPTSFDKDSVNININNADAGQVITLSVSEVLTNGCVFETSVVTKDITAQPRPETPVLDASDSVCKISGAISINAVSGDVGITDTYSWDYAALNVKNLTAELANETAQLNLSFDTLLNPGPVLVTAVSSYGCTSKVPATMVLYPFEIDDFGIDPGRFRCEGSENQMFIVGGQPDTEVTYTWDLGLVESNIIEGQGTDTLKLIMPEADFDVTVTATDPNIQGGCPKSIFVTIDVYEKFSNLDMYLFSDRSIKQTGESFICGIDDERFDSTSTVHSSYSIENRPDADLLFTWYYRFDPLNTTDFELLEDASYEETVSKVIKNKIGDHEFVLVVENNRCPDNTDSISEIYTITAPVDAKYELSPITICVDDTVKAEVRNSFKTDGRDPAVTYTWSIGDYYTKSCLLYDSSFLSFPEVPFMYYGQHQKAEQYDSTTFILVNDLKVRVDSLVSLDTLYYPVYDSTSITVYSGDVVAYDNYYFEANFGDVLEVKADPQYCIIYDRDDENLGLNLLRDTLDLEVVSRPGASLVAYDLDKVNFTGTVTPFDLEGKEQSTLNPFEIEKLEDAFALKEVFNRSLESGFVYPSSKPSIDYTWTWYKDNEQSKEGIVTTSDFPYLARPNIIGRPETVKYQVKTSNGYCADSATVDIKLGYRPWPPNAFSPNNDSFFDKWEIRNVDKYPGTEVKIFNRWGVELLTIPNYDQAENWWDGTKNGDALPTGTYFYWVDFKDGGDPVTGSVSIIK